VVLPDGKVVGVVEPAAGVGVPRVTGAVGDPGTFTSDGPDDAGASGEVAVGALTTMVEDGASWVARTPCAVPDAVLGAATTTAGGIALA
jgi:hypothetical protein